MADAHHAQYAVVAGVILLPRRRRAIVVGVGLAHSDAVQCIGGLCLRSVGERHDEQDLAPCGEHQSAKANGAYPSVCSQPVSVKPSPHGTTFNLPRQNQ